MLISSRPGSPAAVQGISPAAVCRPVLPGFLKIRRGGGRLSRQLSEFFGQRGECPVGRPSAAARPPLQDIFRSFRRGGACPSRRFSELLHSTLGALSFETARRVAAPYGRHSPRRAGGSGDPPLRGNFGPGRCDGHHSHETATVPPEPNGAVKTP